jgi:hypothetical protein
MATSLYNTFVGRDFTARLEIIMAAIRAELPDLTDLNYSGIANVLSRLLASESDYLAFYQDEAYEESAVEYAKFKQSLIHLAATVDELPILASGAQGNLTATKGVDFPDEDLVIPQYTAFTRADALSYLSTDEITFQLAETSVEIPVLQGTLQTLSLVQADFTLLETSNRRVYNLGESVCAGTVTVTSGTSPATTWSEVDSFWRSLPTDNHFSLNLVADGPNDTTDVVYLTLGDGSKGANTFTGTMTVTYIVTDEADGNCGQGVVVDVPAELSGIIEVTNPLPFRGGAAAETTEHLRPRIPATTRAQRRGLTLPDYETIIPEHVPGLKYCQTADRTTNNFWPHEHVIIYAVPAGGGSLPEVMYNNILSVCQEYGHLLGWEGRYIILDATEVSVDVTCVVGVTLGFNSSTVLSQVSTKIQELLSVDNQTINGSLLFSNLFSAVISVSGVKSVNFTTPVADVSANVGEILVAGTISVTAG